MMLDMTRYLKGPAAIALIVLSGVSVMAAANAKTTTPAPTEPPPYKSLRYDEDYRYLQDPTQQSDLWDPIKYIPLFDSPRTYLTLGGELRERFEYYSAPNFGLGGLRPDDYLLHRLLLHADLHIGDYLRTFVQFGDELQAGKARYR